MQWMSPKSHREAKDTEPQVISLKRIYVIKLQ